MSSSFTLFMRLCLMETCMQVPEDPEDGAGCCGVGSGCDLPEEDYGTKLWSFPRVESALHH